MKVNLPKYAKRLCTEGRLMFAEGEEQKNPELKSAGLKILAEGLTQQNPLRERSGRDSNSHVFGREIERS